MSSIYIVPVDSANPQGNAAKLWQATPSAAKPKLGATHIFYGTPDGSDITALVSLGDKFANKKGDARREDIRKAVGSAVKAVKALGEGVEGRKVVVDVGEDPHAAAVAAHLSLFKFNLKTQPQSPFDPSLKDTPPEKLSFAPAKPSKEWDDGVLYAKVQNLTRVLMELPANMMTPTKFCERVEAQLKPFSNVDVHVRDEAWAAEKGMRTFLSVTKGTDEPAKFLEIHYKGAASQEPPLVLVGKGITFDSGGISLKPSADMKLMRGDMGGAATVCATALAVAQLRLPINLVVLTPLAENLPGPSANKPGDVVYAMNGKSVEIDNTDAEGRLVLADALWYGSTEFKAKTVIDVATLTGAMDVALGEIYTGVFTNSDDLWEELYAAGQHEHDRFWRMPLDEEFGPQIYRSNADLCNTGGKPGGACTAALFLKSFVDGVEPADGEDAPKVRWAHIDIAGTMEITRSTEYMETGMSGKGVRALVEYIRRTVKQ